MLKVTANGTTTSPVTAGRLGHRPHPRRAASPPAAGRPGDRARHPRGRDDPRSSSNCTAFQPSCAACHAKFDPYGLRWRVRRLRRLARPLPGGRPGEDPEPGVGKNGHLFEFHLALPVDPSGTLADGAAFDDVEELKRLLLRDERKVARNLARQLIVYATGAPVRFGDRDEVEAILDRAEPAGTACVR